MEIRVLVPSALSVELNSLNGCKNQEILSGESSSSENSSSEEEEYKKIVKNKITSERNSPPSLRQRKSGGESFKIVANERIEKGKTFYPNDDGRIIVLYSTSIPVLHTGRSKYGSFSQKLEDKSTNITLCNWIVLLQESLSLQSANLVPIYQKQDICFRTTQAIDKGQEILVFFASPSPYSSSDEEEKEELPLDLSKSHNSHASVQRVSPFHVIPTTSPSTSVNNLKKDIIENSSGEVSKCKKESGIVTAVLKPILRTRGRERSLLPCSVCAKAFDRPSLLKRHMRTHTGEKPHICEYCSKGFSTSSSLNTHRRIHSGEKPHECGTCGKKFTASSNLYYHRMTHNKEKPHKCFCGKSFPTPGDLKSHQYVHSGSWPFNCPICHRGFSKQTNLRNHLLLHSGDKPHTCPQVGCGKKFALACNLRAHLRTHEEESMSSCTRCKRTFLSSLSMVVNGLCPHCTLATQHPPPPPPHNIFTNPPLLEFKNSGGGEGGGGNPYLHRVLEWNWFHQKILESQVLAAQLMGNLQNTSNI